MRYWASYPNWATVISRSKRPGQKAIFTKFSNSAFDRFVHIALAARSNAVAPP
jgi:hypothetical protein